jgi:hypothetical protein
MQRRKERKKLKIFPNGIPLRKLARWGQCVSGPQIFFSLVPLSFLFISQPVLNMASNSPPDSRLKSLTFLAWPWFCLITKNWGPTISIHLPVKKSRSCFFWANNARFQVLVLHESQRWKCSAKEHNASQSQCIFWYTNLRPWMDVADILNRWAFGSSVALVFGDSACEFKKKKKLFLDCFFQF